MRYEVAIPSYRRADRIGTLTIPLLLAGGVDPARITVWVADRADLGAYAPIQNLGVRLLSHEHGKGVMHARNAIATSYPPGTRLMCFDDDIRAFVRAVDAKTLVPLEDIHGMIERGFAVADGKLWCVAPVPNPYFMRPGRVRTGGLWYAEGAVFGYTVAAPDDIEHQLVSIDHGEDFERSLKFFLHDGAIARLDDIAVRSRYWIEPGGLQEVRTPENVRAGLEYLVRTYPGLATLKITAAGRLNLRLKRFG